MQKKRNTVQRQLIFEAVSALNIHASAEQVYEYVAQRHTNISKATVFRNLSQLSESGELLNIGNFHGSTRYDHNCHDHYHLMCEDCKRIFDVDGDFSDIIDRAEDSDEFDITEYQLTFSGVCQECNAKRDNVQ